MKMPSDRLHDFIMRVYSAGVNNPALLVALNLRDTPQAIADVNAVQRGERFNSTRRLVRSPKPMVPRPRIRSKRRLSA